jgi:hypothetical protein
MRTLLLGLLVAGCNSAGLSSKGTELGPLVDLAALPDGSLRLPCGVTCTSGCCDPAGICQSGVDVSSCGSGGNPCAACVGSDCIAVAGGKGGQCVAPDGSTCNRDTCPSGCCQGRQCITNISEAACGVGGEVCRTCPEGDFCKGGCSHKQATCDASNCAGCCGGPYCSTGLNNNLCGQGGAACIDCRPGPDCQPAGTGGTCGGFAPCLNCTGCCLNGQCVPGDADDQCGGLGHICDNCAVQSAQCLQLGGGDRGCGTPLYCTNQSCAGCCLGAVCAVGTQDIACGAMGATCISCSARMQKCLNGTCG